MHHPIPERGYATLTTMATADAGDPQTELEALILASASAPKTAYQSDCSSHEPAHCVCQPQ